MEKDIAKIPKNSDTDIVVRIDDFGGRKGLTIREFVKSEKYSGFTKAGTRVPADKFKEFKQAINSIDEKDLEEVKKEELPVVQPKKEQQPIVDNKVEKKQDKKAKKEPKSSGHSMRASRLADEPVKSDEPDETEDVEF